MTIEEWQPVNERRCDLIDKEIARTITSEEAVELESLQRMADDFIAEHAPIPVKELEAVIDKLKAEGKWVEQ